MDFKLKNGEQVRTVKVPKASDTVIEAGDCVALSSGLIIKAVAGSTKIAYAPNGAPAGVTEVDVTVGNDFTLVGTGSTTFVVATHRGAEVDLSTSSNNQRIDLGNSSTDVFVVGISSDSATVGSASNIEVKINKPLF